MSLRRGEYGWRVGVSLPPFAEGGEGGGAGPDLELVEVVDVGAVGAVVGAVVVGMVESPVPPPAEAPPLTFPPAHELLTTPIPAVLFHTQSTSHGVSGKSRPMAW